MKFALPTFLTRPFLIIYLLTGIPLLAQQRPDAEAKNEEPMSSFQAVNASIDTILQQYEQLTGNVLIKDSNLAANALPITISVPEPVPRTELIRLIESALLLNNYALIPGSEPKTVKVININTGKNPRSEGVRLYASPAGLPEGEQIVSYFMSFRYISANEALTVFQTHILPRAYTSFVPISSAQALLITEDTSVIRQLIALQHLIDVPPAKTVTEFVQLVRADAERVADTINKLAEYQQKGREGAGGPGGPNPAPQPVASVPTTSTGESSIFGQLIPDTRTNRILIVCRPQNLEYVRSLIEDFDKEVILAKPLEYRLKYVSAGEVLPVLGQVLAETQKEAEQVQGAGTQQNQPQQPGQTRTVNLPSTTSSYGGITGAGTTGGQAENLLQEPNEPTGPQAVIVGKTRIISDSKDNKILVMGPPESIQRVRGILDRLDQRPQQVYLATVIGQLTLSNDLNFGVDWTTTFKKLGGGNGFAASNLNVAGISGLGSTAPGSAPLIDPRQILTTAAVPGLQGLAIYGSISDSLRVFIRALDNRDNFTILARPAVYTANNKLAIITSGQRIPYPGTTLSNVTTTTTTTPNTAAVAATVEFVDVSLRLEVIPLINSNNEVTLKVAQTNDTQAGNQLISGNEVPIINSQRLTTTVTIPSGATIVLGGLIQDNLDKSDNGIPYLSRIPYLGNLFKYHTQTHKRTELLIFIQPTIVNTDWQTVAQSIKEERRTQLGPPTLPLARPEAVPSPAPAVNARKKKGYTKD
jgi:general secretion pathway protein D